MAYNYFPGYYQPNYMQQMQPSFSAPQPAQQKSSDFVIVRSEEEARNYPVAFGNTVTFKDENTAYMYTKTMGMSQLDRPIFEKYKLVKETDANGPQTACTEKDDNSIIEKLQSEIGALWREIEALKNKLTDEEGA